jgi:hypothetical protein
MGAAAGADDRVDLVNDDGPHRAEHLAASFGRQQQVERFGCCDQNVRWGPQHRRALRLGRVAGADGGRDARGLHPSCLGELPDPAPRLGEVFMNVSAQRFQW